MNTFISIDTKLEEKIYDHAV